MAAAPPFPSPGSAHRPDGPLAGETGSDPLVRLADQLHALSQLAETLTIRLLELEERLQLQQERLEPLLDAAQGADTAQAEALDLRLDETEERLSQLEALLQGGAALRAVPAYGSRLRQDRQSIAADTAAIDPFPEEGEQPFMDERVA